jgi:hypothetical protein
MCQDPLDAELTSLWAEKVLPVMKTHCGECHMDGANEAGVNLGDYSTLEKIRSHESTWEQIRGVIRAEAMPPAESSKMSTQERALVTQWIERTLHEVDCNHRPTTPHVTVRRLNQFEYDNTIRDVFGVDFKPSKEIGFVSDDVGNGFDNQGEVLTLAPIALEKYLQAAALISKRVISLDRESFRKQSFEGEYLPFGQSLSVPIYVASGKYTVSIRTRFGDDQKDNCKAKLWLDETLISEWDVAPKDETAKYDFETTAGDHVLRIEYADDTNPENRSAGNRRLIIHSVRLVGPEQGDPAFPRIHQQVVIATPQDKDQTDAMPIGFTEATRRVFNQLLPKLYRRTVSDDEVHAVMMICQKASDAGCSYEESLRYGLQGALVAPQFLFRSESFVQSDAVRRLDDFGIATRLSYFLWASTPDETLLKLAAENRLHEPEVLQAEVLRMLQDPRSESLITGFFSQWLGLRNIQKIDIDRDKFPMWSDRLRAAMVKETEMFCKHVLHEGSIEDFLTADYTFVNPRLAEFYGVEFDGQQPSEMYKRRPGRNDGDPTRSSAVKRGKWVLETVLGDPPPSAPPNVPSLEQAKADDHASLRERLEIHRSNPSCAGCHKLIDPIGLGLENFDATGRWRDQEDGREILAQGSLVDGKTFTGPTELIKILSDRTPDVAKNFTQRLLTYALGRGLQRADRCDVDKILAHAQQNRYTIKSLILEIVQSDSFLQRSLDLPQTQANRN